MLAILVHNKEAMSESMIIFYPLPKISYRLVQTECADGKIVETGTGSGGRDSEDCKDGAKNVDGVTVNSDEKLDSIQLEYTYLLTSQLEAQRR